VTILVVLVPLALALGGLGLAAFLWSLRSGQYDDLDGAAVRVLSDDDLFDMIEQRIAGRGADSQLKRAIVVQDAGMDHGARRHGSPRSFRRRAAAWSNQHDVAWAQLGRWNRGCLSEFVDARRHRRAQRGEVGRDRASFPRIASSQ